MDDFIWATVCHYHEACMPCLNESELLPVEQKELICRNLR